MKAKSARRRGMSPLQTVLLLGAAFVVTWGLQEIWRQLQPLVAPHVHRILGVESVAAPRPADRGGTDRGLPRDLFPPELDGAPKPGETKTDRENGWTPDWLIGWTQDLTDGLWGAGVSLWPGGVNLEAVWAASKELRVAAEGFGRQNGHNSGERNSLQHAYWQALLAFRFGPEVAQRIGDKHESWQDYGSALRQRDSEADRWNNQIGRLIGVHIRREADGPQGARPGYDPQQRMRELILEALAHGWLDAKR